MPVPYGLLIPLLTEVIIPLGHETLAKRAGKPVSEFSTEDAIKHITEFKAGIFSAKDLLGYDSSTPTQPSS
jgi:hypothetical protein